MEIIQTTINNEFVVTNETITAEHLPLRYLDRFCRISFADINNIKKIIVINTDTSEIIHKANEVSIADQWMLMKFLQTKC